MDEATDLEHANANLIAQQLFVTNLAFEISTLLFKDHEAILDMWSKRLKVVLEGTELRFAPGTTVDQAAVKRLAAAEVEGLIAAVRQMHAFRLRKAPPSGH